MLRQQWAQAEQRVHKRGAEGEAKREGMTRLALVRLIERDRRHVRRGETVGRRKPSQRLGAAAGPRAAGPQPRRKARKSPIAALRLMGYPHGICRRAGKARMSRQIGSSYSRFGGGTAMTRKLASEFIGTFALVSSVCGAALFSAPSAGLMAVAFAIGTAVLAMIYAVGPISGGHFNPAVTCGLAAAGRFNMAEVIPYIVVQVIGGVVAAAVFYLILSGAPAGKWNDFVAISNIYGGEGHFRCCRWR